MLNQMTEINERVARIEVEVKSVHETLSGLKGYMERGAAERTMHHTLVIERLTRSETKQDSLAVSVDKYQNECTIDREKLDDKLIAIEKAQSNSKAVGGAIAAIISGAMVAIGIGIDFWKKG